MKTNLYLNDVLSNLKRGCSPDFPFLYIHENILKKLRKQKILSLKQLKRFVKKFMKNN